MEFSDTPPIQPWFTTEKRIIDAHDPVVALDAARKLLITERSLVVLRDAAAWTAKIVGLPGPDDTFIPLTRQKIQAGYSTFPDSLSHGLAKIADNTREEKDCIKEATPAKLGAIFAQKRDQLAAVHDPAEKQWWLASFTATFADATATVQRQTVEAMKQAMIRSVIYSGLLMNQQSFSQIMQTQQKNAGHAMRGERPQMTPYGDH